MNARAIVDCALLGGTSIVYGLLRFPKRPVFRGSALLLGLGFVAATVSCWHGALGTSNFLWGVAGALSATTILGGTLTAMILGHWYLVVRGMSIEPLKRLAWSCLGGAVFRLLVVTIALTTLAEQGVGWGSPLRAIFVSDGIFFWMRVGWGLLVPLLLFPMIWGTVKIRSTMAATGILYVAVVAVVIGEVLGVYLSARHGLPI